MSKQKKILLSILSVCLIAIAAVTYTSNPDFFKGAYIPGPSSTPGLEDQIEAFYNERTRDGVYTEDINERVYTIDDYRNLGAACIHYANNSSNDFDCPNNGETPERSTRSFPVNQRLIIGEAIDSTQPFIAINSSRGSVFSGINPETYDFFIYKKDHRGATVYRLDGETYTSPFDWQSYDNSSFYVSTNEVSSVNRVVGIYDLEPDTYEIVAVKTTNYTGGDSNVRIISNALTITLEEPEELLPEEPEVGYDYNDLIDNLDAEIDWDATDGTFGTYERPPEIDLINYEIDLINPSVVYKREHTEIPETIGATEPLPNPISTDDPVIFIASSNFSTERMTYEIVHQDAETGIRTLKAFYEWDIPEYEISGEMRRAVPIFRIEWDGQTCGNYDNDNVKQQTVACPDGAYIIRAKAIYNNGSTEREFYNISGFNLTSNAVPGSVAPSITLNAPSRIDIATTSSMDISQSELDARGGILPSDNSGGATFTYGLNFDTYGVFGFITKDEQLKGLYINSSVNLDLAAKISNGEALTTAEENIMIELVEALGLPPEDEATTIEVIRNIESSTTLEKQQLLFLIQGASTIIDRVDTFNWDGQTCVNYIGGEVILEECEEGIYEFHIYSANEFDDRVETRRAIRVFDSSTYVPAPRPEIRQPRSGSTVTPTVREDGVEITTLRVLTDIPAACFASSSTDFSNIGQLPANSDDREHKTTVNVLNGTNTFYVLCTSDITATPNSTFNGIDHSGSLSDVVSTTFTVTDIPEAPVVTIETPADGSTVTPDIEPSGIRTTELRVNTDRDTACFTSEHSDFRTITKISSDDNQIHTIDIPVGEGSNRWYVKCTDDLDADVNSSGTDIINDSGQMSGTVSTNFFYNVNTGSDVSCTLNYTFSNTLNSKFDPDTESITFDYTIDGVTNLDHRVRIIGPLDPTADDLIASGEEIFSIEPSTVNLDDLPYSNSFIWEGRGEADEILEDGVYLAMLEVDDIVIDTDDNYDCDDVRPIQIEHTGGSGGEPVIKLSVKDVIVPTGENQVVTFTNAIEASKLVINLYRTDQSKPLATAYFYCGPDEENCPENNSENLAPTTKSIALPYRYFSNKATYYFKASIKTDSGKIYKVRSAKFAPESDALLPQCNFADVNPADPRFEDIMRVCELGIMVGSQDPYNPQLRRFEPFRVVNRIEGITISNNLSICPAFKYNSSDGDLGFVDMQQYLGNFQALWMFDQIKKGINCLGLTGYIDGTVRPANNLSNAEAWKITLEAIQNSGLARFNPIYADTNKSPWWSDYEFFLRQNGFRLPNPTQEITRAEVASLIVELERKGLFEVIEDVY